MAQSARNKKLSRGGMIGTSRCLVQWPLLRLAGTLAVLDRQADHLAVAFVGHAGLDALALAGAPLDRVIREHPLAIGHALLAAGFSGGIARSDAPGEIATHIIRDHRGACQRL